MREFSRNDFIRVTGGALAGYALFGCGNENMEQLPSLDSSDFEQQLLANDQLNEPATALEQAVRLNPPKPLPPPKTWQAGQFINSVAINYNGTALNYDDGPSPYNTIPILNTLGKYGIKASFYLIGVNVIAWPDIARRIVEEGHEVGNHSRLHSPYSAAPLAAQIPENQNIIHGATGVYPVSNRAPGLTRGQIILDTCRANGLYEVHTTIDSQDWKSPRIPASSIVNNVLGPLHPGSIPLQHDGGNRRPTPDAQEAIIQGAKARGYVFNTVTGLINTGIPLPGSFTYSALVDNSFSNLTSDVEFTPTCNYDPAVELRTRLNDSSTKYAEKMRITEALLQLEEAAQEQ